MALRRRKKKKAPKRVCRTVRTKSGRKRRVCRPRRPVAARPPRPAPGLPVPSPAAPPVVTASPPASTPPAGPVVAPAPSAPSLPLPDTPAQTAWGPRQAERLLWRAGFGPRPGDVERFAALTPREAVHALTRPTGAANLVPADRPPRDHNGNPLDPGSVWGHDHLWWLDRMVRGDQPLVERLTLIWHDWFATTEADVGDQRIMLAQNELLRRHALGSFRQLALDVTTDPAMLLFLNGIDNRRGRPNENYARELMELFTLGADRGAYTETDVRELARALTGWRADWVDGWRNFRFDPNRQDTGTKTVFGRTGAFDWRDAVRLCLEHPMHASFFVRKLWSYFVPTAPDATMQELLEQIYVRSGYEIRPVVEAILLHPDLYDGAPLVKPPVVFAAGLLRARSRTINDMWWSWFAESSGQMLFRPPNVSGWNDQGWLNTNTLKGRWSLVWRVLEAEYVARAGYSATETPVEAVEAALAHWGRPTLSAETRAELERFAADAVPAGIASWEQSMLRADRQNALRHLVATCPDAQVC